RILSAPPSRISSEIRKELSVGSSVFVDCVDFWSCFWRWSANGWRGFPVDPNTGRLEDQIVRGRASAVLVLVLSLMTVRSFAQQGTLPPLNTSNLWYNEFVFLPGGFRAMAKTIAATNDTFRRSLLYIGASRAGHPSARLPEGITQSDISNTEYQVYTWPVIMPPRTISFYGKVVDEQGMPVAGATAHFSWDGTVTNKNIMEWRDWPTISEDVISDTNGLFYLTGKLGTQLNVAVSKAGYYSSQTNRGLQREQFK